MTSCQAELYLCELVWWDHDMSPKVTMLNWKIFGDLWWFNMVPFYDIWWYLVTFDDIWQFSMTKPRCLSWYVMTYNELSWYVTNQFREDRHTNGTVSITSTTEVGGKKTTTFFYFKTIWQIFLNISRNKSNTARSFFNFWDVLLPYIITTIIIWSKVQLTTGGYWSKEIRQIY